MNSNEQKQIIKNFFNYIKDDFLINKDYVDQKLEEFFSNGVINLGNIDQEEFNNLLISKTEEHILSNYKFNLDLLLKSNIDKRKVIDILTLTEDFIEKALDQGYFITDDISRFSMSTYANLSTQFLEKHNDYIRWDKMISYICTKTDDITSYESTIEKYNLWWAISANDLPIEFIRKWKDNLDWRYLSIVKKFTPEETKEFSDYIILKPSEFVEQTENTSKNIINYFNDKL